MGLITSGLGAHLTWTLPFGLLIMFAVFNRFNPAYEEAARDLGASSWQTFAHVVLPIIAPSLVGVGLFGFTLSWDEIARSSQAVGLGQHAALDLQGLTTTVTTPVIYALGTVTTGISFAVIILAICHRCWLVTEAALATRIRRRQGLGVTNAAAPRQSEHDVLDDRDDRGCGPGGAGSRNACSRRSIRPMGRPRSRAISTRPTAFPALLAEIRKGRGGGASTAT